MTTKKKPAPPKAPGPKKPNWFKRALLVVVETAATIVFRGIGGGR